MTTAQIIPVETRQALLKMLASLPQEEWLQLCKHPHQRQHWQECRQLYGLIEMGLKAFFKGSESPFSNLNKCDREFLERLQERWILLYSVLHYGWQDIIKDAQKLGVMECLGATPGQTILMILRDEAARQIWPCLEFSRPANSRFSPSASHKIQREYNRLTRKLNSAQRISPREQEEIDRLDKKILDSMPPLTLIFCKLFCLAACEKAAKQNKVLRDKLKQYKQNEGEITVEIMRVTHPQKKPQGYQWINGEKVLTSS